MRRKILFLAVPIILVLFMVDSLLINPHQGWAENVQLAKEAPDFILADIYGNTFHLSDFKGKVILIDFWATWCPFCRASIPILISLYNDYKDKGFEIIGIALEYDGGKALKRFVEEKNITYPVLIGNEKLAKDYSVYGLPTRFFINREGKIVEKFIGYQEKEVLQEVIEEIL